MRYLPHLVIYWQPRDPQEGRSVLLISPPHNSRVVSYGDLKRTDMKKPPLPISKTEGALLRIVLLYRIDIQRKPDNKDSAITD